jgi:hypothetical protein
MPLLSPPFQAVIEGSEAETGPFAPEGAGLPVPSDPQSLCPQGATVDQDRVSIARRRRRQERTFKLKSPDALRTARWRAPGGPLSQAGLSARLKESDDPLEHCDPSFPAQLEGGYRDGVTEPLARAMARVLGVDLWDLFIPR